MSIRHSHFSFLSICIPVCPSVPVLICLFVCLCLFPSVCLSVWAFSPFVCLYVLLLVPISFCLSAWQCESFCPCLSIRLSEPVSIRLSEPVSICLFICLFSSLCLSASSLLLVEFSDKTPWTLKVNSNKKKMWKRAIELCVWQIYLLITFSDYKWFPLSSEHWLPPLHDFFFFFFFFFISSPSFLSAVSSDLQTAT